MKTPPCDPFLFLVSNRQFAINLVCRWGFRYEEAEDIVAELAARWVKRPATIPQVLNRAVLVGCLRQRKEDFRRRRDAVKRGRDFFHVSDEVLEGVPGEVVELPHDRIPGLVMLLKAEKARSHGRKQILLRVMIRGLIEGTSGRYWYEEFTEEERHAFIGESDQCSDRDFRKAVSRVLAELVKALRQRAQLN